LSFTKLRGAVLTSSANNRAASSLAEEKNSPICAMTSTIVKFARCALGRLSSSGRYTPTNFGSGWNLRMFSTMPEFSGRFGIILKNFSKFSVIAEH
jgi:hypothetical protein